MDLTTVNALFQIAVIVELDGVDFIARFTEEELAESYNGIGPEFLPPTMREKVTEHLSLFAPAALIHDLRNEYSDGTRCSFNYANYEFLANCRKLAAQKYAWYNPRRYIAYSVAKLLYKFVCSDGGWTAWIQAKERHEKKIFGNSTGKTQTTNNDKEQK